MKKARENAPELITLAQVKESEKAAVFIEKADASLKAIGYTEHGYAHVGTAADRAARVLEALGRPAREIELARIAGYLHDIGNLVNRNDHAHTGAVLAGRILEDMGMQPDETADIMCAIGNHDESTGLPVSPLAAALIIGDKTDVRRSRVRFPLTRVNDIHDRVNGAVTNADFSIDGGAKAITLSLTVDTSHCDVLEYFQIFITRMQMCKNAARFLGMEFRLVINGALMMG